MRPAVKRAADATKSALSELKPGDRLAVMVFDCQTDLIADFTGVFGAARHFRKQPSRKRRRALVVITHDRGAPTKPVAARDMVGDLWAADVVVLGLIVPTAGVHFSIGPPYRGARSAADQTGGDTLETGEAAGGLQEMIRRLRSRGGETRRMAKDTDATDQTGCQALSTSDGTRPNRIRINGARLGPVTGSHLAALERSRRGDPRHRSTCRSDHVFWARTSDEQFLVRKLPS